MLAHRAFSEGSISAAPAPEAYFNHRAAVGRTPKMLLSADLDVLWLNAAALALTSRSGPAGLTGGRLILPQRGQEDGLREFLGGLEGESGAWALTSPEGQWLIHAEIIAPADAPPAWLLTWRVLDDPGRYQWADIGVALGLTRSETRLLHMLIAGQTVDEAAVDLAISVQTARTHVRRIYAKLDVSNREQLFATVLPYRWG